MLWDLIPTCDDPMSIYTLIAFVLYTIALLAAGAYINRRFDKQDESVKMGGYTISKLQDDINQIKIDLAVVSTAQKSIESDGRETRKALAEINRILINKLT